MNDHTEPPPLLTTTMYDASQNSDEFQDPHIIEGAEVAQAGSPIPDQPVAFFAEIETISLLMKYEKIFESFKEMAFNGADYLEKDLGVPYPVNYVIVAMSSILSLYLSSLIRPLLCPKKRQNTHVFNTIDSIDMAKLMKTLEKIEKQGSGATQVASTKAIDFTDAVSLAIL